MYTEARKRLTDWCKGRHCSDCPVAENNPKHMCGDGSQFLVKTPVGSYEIHDKDVIRAYVSAFDAEPISIVDCCEDCFYDDCTCEEFPCTHCKQNIPHSDPSYETAVSQWTSKYVEHEPDNPVTHPSHYTQGNIQCIDAMESAFGKEAVATWCKLNSFKYIWRSEHKNGMEDIDKAIWYLNKFKELSA